MSDSHQGWLSIKDAAEKTGLSEATIRYYDQQFEEYLGVARGRGRRRLFSPESLARLSDLKKLLKDEGLSIRQARQRLAGGGGASPSAPDQVRQLQAEVTGLSEKVRSLETQVKELTGIQARTLELLQKTLDGRS